MRGVLALGSGEGREGLGRFWFWFWLEYTSTIGTPHHRGRAAQPVFNSRKLYTVPPTDPACGLEARRMNVLFMRDPGVLFCESSGRFALSTFPLPTQFLLRISPLQGLTCALPASIACCNLFSTGVKAPLSSSHLLRDG